MNDLTVNQPTAPKSFSYNTEAPPTIAPKQPPKLLPLYNENNPMLALKQPEFDVKNPPVNIIDFANQLLYTMSHYGGVGLAAPQCGFPFRMFVMTGGIVCINPVIVERSKETIYTKEGCLSFPGLYLPVTRPETVLIRYTNEYGKEVEVRWTGATARCAQHEYDHLEGKVYTSLVGNLTLQMAKKKRQKLFKKIQRAVEIKQRNLRIAGKDKAYVAKTVENRPVEIETHRQG
jgi:peptide deformylase